MRSHILSKNIVEIAIFSALVNILTLVSPLYMLQVYDRVITSGSMSTHLYISLIAFSALFVLGAIEVVRAYYGNRIAARFDKEIGSEAFTASITGSRAGLGDVQPLRDLATLRGFIANRQIFALFDLPFSPLFIVILYFIHPVLFWVTIAGVVVIVLIAMANNQATAASTRKAGESLSNSMIVAQGFARNFETVRALGMIGSATEAWGRRYSEAIAESGRVADVNAFFGGASRLVRMGLQMAILGIGAYLVLHEHLSAGIIFASAIVSGRALQPLDQMIGGWRQFLETREAWKRLGALVDHGLGKTEDLVALPRPAGALGVENVTYFVPDSDPSLPLIKRISFKVEAGESVAVIGPSRAGKSTLARLIVGAIPPQSGCVRVDGADLKNWGVDQIGRHIGYLSQEVELFPGTIAENIARFDPAARDEAVIEAAERADVHRMILSQKKGYNTQIGPNGVRLSGGERQRIGLARAFYGRPVLMVLDEPNANLDAEGEQALERAIAGAREAKVTVLLITHKPSIAARCDRILMLRDGAIELFGPSADVLKRLMQGNVPVPAPAETGQASQRSAKPAFSTNVGAAS